MSEYTIKMNFRKALEKASDLEDASDCMKRLAEQQLGQTLNDLSKCWTGENSSQYMIKGGKLQEKLLKTAEKMYQTAETIRQIAQEIYEAEMEALRIARERKHR